MIIRVVYAAIAAILVMSGPYLLFAAEPAVGKMMLINEAKREITLHHGPLDDLGLPAKSTTFHLEDFDLIKGVVLGDAVRFEAKKSGAQFQIISIEKTDEVDDDHHH